MTAGNCQAHDRPANCHSAVGDQPAARLGIRGPRDKTGTGPVRATKRISGAGAGLEVFPNLHSTVDLVDLASEVRSGPARFPRGPPVVLQIACQAQASASSQ